MAVAICVCMNLMRSCWNFNTCFVELNFSVGCLLCALAGSDCRACDYSRDKNIPILAYPKGKNAPEGITPSELVQSLRCTFATKLFFSMAASDDY